MLKDIGITCDLIVFCESHCTCGGSRIQNPLQNIAQNKIVCDKAVDCNLIKVCSVKPNTSAKRKISDRVKNDKAQKARIPNRQKYDSGTNTKSKVSQNMPATHTIKKELSLECQQEEDIPFVPSTLACVQDLSDTVGQNTEEGVGKELSIALQSSPPSVAIVQAVSSSVVGSDNNGIYVSIFPAKETCMGSQFVELKAKTEVFVLEDKLSREKRLKMQKKQYEMKVQAKYSCGKCSFQACRYSHLLKHSEKHVGHDTDIFKCEKCGFKAISKTSLTRHCNSSHPSARLECCGQLFTTQASLKKHKKQVHNAINRECKICPFQTESEKLYQRHLNSHRTEAGLLVSVFKCPHCEFETKKKVLYKLHVQDKHQTGPKGFLCEQCGVDFKRRDALVQHCKFQHPEGEEKPLPFECDQCNKHFRSKAHLQEHSLTHSSIRQYECGHCHCMFKTKSNWKKHISKVHCGPSRSSICDDCGRNFFSVHRLSCHKRSRCCKPIDQPKLAQIQKELESSHKRAASMPLSVPTASTQGLQIIIQGDFGDLQSTQPIMYVQALDEHRDNDSYPESCVTLDPGVQEIIEDAMTDDFLSYVVSAENDVQQDDAGLMMQQGEAGMLYEGMDSDGVLWTEQNMF